MATIDAANRGSCVMKIAPFVWSVTDSLLTFTVLLSMAPARSRLPDATTSITPCSSASSAVSDNPSVTNFSATSVDRFRFSAIPRILAAYALTVLFSTGVVPVGVIAIGVAAPVAVPGAIAAMCPERRMNAPAENARSPCGTNVITGTSERSISDTIPSIESTSPPGVFISISTAAAPISVA